MTNYEANSNNWNDKKVKTYICLSHVDGARQRVAERGSLAYQLWQQYL